MARRAAGRNAVKHYTRGRSRRSRSARPALGRIRRRPKLGEFIRCERVSCTGACGPSAIVTRLPCPLRLLLPLALSLDFLSQSLAEHKKNGADHQSEHAEGGHPVRVRVVQPFGQVVGHLIGPLVLVRPSLSRLYHGSHDVRRPQVARRKKEPPAFVTRQLVCPGTREGAVRKTILNTHSVAQGTLCSQTVLGRLRGRAIAPRWRQGSCTRR